MTVPKIVTPKENNVKILLDYLHELDYRKVSSVEIHQESHYMELTIDVIITIRMVP